MFEMLPQNLDEVDALYLYLSVEVVYRHLHSSHDAVVLVCDVLLELAVASGFQILSLS